MAYRELGMVELREIVRRWQGGEGVRALARGTGMDRKTIAAYLRAAQAAGVQPGSGPPTDEQLTVIVATRRPGRPANTAAPSPEFEVLRPHAAQIRAWLTEGLRLTKIYRRLREQGAARLVQLAVPVRPGRVRLRHPDDDRPRRRPAAGRGG